MNRYSSPQNIKDPAIFLCNSVGISFGFPEPEIFRVYSSLKHAGSRVILDNLRIKIYSRLEKLFTDEYLKKILKSINPAKLSYRITMEEKNGLIEDYLFLALNSFYTYKRNHHIKYKKNLLTKTRRVIIEEFNLLIKTILNNSPDIICFFITPRKVREITKSHNQHLEIEFLFPIVFIEQLKKYIDAVFILSCNLSAEAIITTYKNINCKTNFDFIIYKDFEKNIGRIAQKLTIDKKIPSNLPGTINIKENHFIKNSPIYDKKMNYIIPYYPPEELNKYSNKNKNLCLQVECSAGCPLKCAFCNVKHIFGPYRKRDAEDIAKELFYYRNNLRIKFINFNDRIFNGNIKSLEKLCDILINNRYDGEWICYAAVRPEMSLRLLKKMYLAGCRIMSLGVESGSKKILKKMNKDYSPKLASRIIRNAHNSGISINLEIMTDFPEETDADFKKTLSFIKENFNHTAEFRINRFEPYPGSDIFKNPAKYGLRKKDLFKNFQKTARLDKIKEYIAQLEKSKTR